MAFDMSEIVWTSGILAQNIKKWQSVMNMVMNLQVPYDAGSSFTSWGIVSFSRRSLPNSVSLLVAQSFCCTGNW